ncbi:MAG: branched-chain amino acid transport system permease protein [Thermodesulfobacteriota bacterium]|nr:branched-chain amino acid transport system permease protein [Thermodesulfobacteriota bacterium]
MILKKALSGRNVAGMAILVVLVAFPLLRPPVYFTSFIFTVFMYVSLAASWNYIGGYAGYLSFGHVAFFGIGAYTTALVTKALSLSPIGTIFSALLGGGVASLIAVIIGFPTLRLRGPYFAVITMCFAFVVQLLVQNLDVLGGADGLWMKTMDLPIEISRAVMYELMLILMVATTITSILLDKSKFGMGLRAIKEDEDVGQTMAINAPVLKIQAFALSAFFPGIAGGFYAYYLTYIHPDIVFNVNISILIVLMALFGGGGTWLGPILGATILTIVNEGLSTFMKAEIARIIYGCLFIVVIVFMPNGMMEFFRKKAKKVVETGEST